jgi:hypothetical protein
MEIDLILCRAWSVSNRRPDFWYRGHSESELRTFWQRAKSAEALGREPAVAPDCASRTLARGNVSVRSAFERVPRQPGDSTLTARHANG